MQIVWHSIHSYFLQIHVYGVWKKYIKYKIIGYKYKNIEYKNKIIEYKYQIIEYKNIFLILQRFTHHTHLLSCVFVVSLAPLAYVMLSSCNDPSCHLYGVRVGSMCSTDICFTFVK